MATRSACMPRMRPTPGAILPASATITTAASLIVGAIFPRHYGRPDRPIDQGSLSDGRAVGRRHGDRSVDATGRLDAAVRAKDQSRLCAWPRVMAKPAARPGRSSICSWALPLARTVPCTPRILPHRPRRIRQEPAGLPLARMAAMARLLPANTAKDRARLRPVEGTAQGLTHRVETVEGADCHARRFTEHHRAAATNPY